MSKLGIWLPRSISRAISSQREDSPEPFHIRENAEDATEDIDEGLRRRVGANSSTASDLLPRVRRIGRSVIRSNPPSQPHSRAPSQGPIALSGVPASPTSVVQEGKKDDPSENHTSGDPLRSNTPQAIQLNQRAIRFPDEVARSQPT